MLLEVIAAVAAEEEVLEIVMEGETEQEMSCCKGSDLMAVFKSFKFSSTEVLVKASTTTEEEVAEEEGCITTVLPTPPLPPVAVVMTMLLLFE